MCEAVKTMSEVANGNYPASQVVYEGIVELEEHVAPSRMASLLRNLEDFVI